MKTVIKNLSLLLFVVFVFHLTACKTEEECNSSNIGMPIINEYLYQKQETHLNNLHFSVSGARAHGEQIVFWYVDSNADVVIVTIDTDGNVLDEIHIPMPSGLMQVEGLRITDDGFYEFVTAVKDTSGDVTIIYGLYNQKGEEIKVQLLIDNVPQLDGFFRIEQTVFTDDGNIAIVLWNSGEKNILYLFSNDKEPLGKSIVEKNQYIVRLKDGRIMLSAQSVNTQSLHEIIFSNGSWGESFLVNVTDIQELFPTEASQSHDFLLDDGTFLVGYTMETGEQTRFINLIETNITTGQEYFAGFLSNNQIFVLYSVPLFTGGHVNWSTSLFVFSNTNRVAITEQCTVITIGGIWFSEEIRREIMNFNSENQEYQIEIRDYLAEAVSWEAGEMRFLTDMITGNGPDIIVDAAYQLINPTYLLDLYPFIDADISINRRDFFQNILKTLETSDGRLPLMTNAFSIQTMLAMRDNEANVEPLTFDNLLLLLNDLNSPDLAGDYMSRENFIYNAINYSGNDFIDWESNYAKLNSDTFIAMLEIASHLPEKQEGIIYFDDTDLRKLLSGEQLLHQFTLHDPDSYHIIQAATRASVVAVGMPTSSGGQGIVVPREGIGINSSSPHKELAWEFIRRFLLPEGKVFFGMPIRIDKYENRITELMTPVLWEETIPIIGAVAGEVMPRELLISGEKIYIYAMTQEEAATVRAIIDSAGMRRRFNNEVWMIVREDSQAFFAGLRTAADTARIMQNRVQTYLDERN
jgi:hypothetical protein